MFYLIIVGIGALVGFVAGQSLRGGRHGSGLDAFMGAVGGCVAVVLASRVLGPVVAAGWFVSIIAAVIGAAFTLFVIRNFMMPKRVSAKGAPRR